MFFASVGNGPGQLWLPSGIHIADDDQIYVVSQYNWRVNTYKYLGEPDLPPLPDTDEDEDG